MDLLDQMKTFTRIVDTGRLSAAARSLRLSVAAVSRQLGALEQDLGTTLIVRSTRRLAVTESGRRWYAHCVQVLHDVEMARADVTEGDAVQGRVVVSAPASYCLHFLAPCFDQLAREHPLLRIELRAEDLAVDPVGEGVDVAVRVGMTLPDSTALIAHRLRPFRRVLVATPGYVRRKGTPRHPSDLLQHDLLVHARASRAFTRWTFERGEESVEITPFARLSSSSPVMLREWAAAGAGIALIADWFAGDLRRLMPGWVTPSIDVYALQRAETRTAPRVRTVVDALLRV